MVNTPNKNFLPLPVGRYGKSTKRSTQWHHHSNEGKSGLQAEKVRALGGLGSLRSKKKLLTEKRQDTHCSSNEEKEKWFEDYVERETTGAKRRVEEAEGAVQQQQDDIMHADIATLTSWEPEETFEEMLVAIGDSLSDLASYDDGEDVEDEDDEETDHGKMTEEDEPGWVMGTITKTVPQQMERFRQQQLNLNELTKPAWENAADYLRERDTKYGTFELRVSTLVQAQTNDDAPAPPPTTFVPLMQSLDIVHGISQRPQGTSRPGNSHIGLGSVNLQSKSSIPSGEPAAEPDSSSLLKAKPVEPVSSVEPVIFYPCI